MQLGLTAFCHSGLHRKRCPPTLCAVARRLKARLEQIQGDVDQLPDVRRLKRTISLASRTQVGRAWVETRDWQMCRALGHGRHPRVGTVDLKPRDPLAHPHS